MSYYKKDNAVCLDSFLILKNFFSSVLKNIYKPISYMLSKTIFRRSKSSILLISVLIVVSVILSFVLKRAGESIQQEIQAEVAPSVWGDLVIQWSRPIDPQKEILISQRIATEQWKISKKVEMNYTLTTEQWPLLVSLWWVDDLFPLYGEFESIEYLWTWTPGSSSWEILMVSKSLYDTLSVWNTAETLSFQSTAYEIDVLYESAPGTTLSVFDGWRQIILPLSLVSKADLLVQWSRVSYKTLITIPDSSEEKTKRLQISLQEILWPESWYRVSTLHESEWVFQSVQDSLSGYLSLVNLLFLLLTICVLIFLWSRIVHENQPSVQIMRIYGLRDRTIRKQVFLWVILCVLWGTLWWILLTYGLTVYLSSLNLLSSTSRIFSSYIPIVFWIWCLMMGVVALPVWLATRSSPLDLLDQSPVPLGRTLSWKAICVWLLMITLSYRFFVWSIATVLLHISSVWLLWICTWWIIWWLHTLLYKIWTSMWWRKTYFEQRDILRFLTKPWTQSSLITTWCTILMILLSRTVMMYIWLQERLTWLTTWGDSLFVTNVFDDDLQKVDELSFPVKDVFNVILWRIVTINSVPLQQHLTNQWIRWDQQNSFTREFNMTSNKLEDTPRTSWSILKNEGDLSVDEEFAQRLGITLWDAIVISIAWREFPLTVVNTRSSVRDGVRPFFYFQLLTSQFEKAPKTSFFQVDITPEKKWSIMNEIVKLMWNNVSFIDTGEIIAEVKSYIDRVWLLLSVLFWLMLVYALSAIFSLFRYAAIFQKERFSVYELLWAWLKSIKTMRRWYVNIYLLIAGTISVLSSLVFVFIFTWSQILEVTKSVVWYGILTIFFVSLLVWIVSREK